MKNAILFETVFYTPAMASAALARNAHNRTARASWVKALATDIATGAFPLTHQPIAFGPDGELIDGQHRLKGIVDANVGAWLCVARYTSADVATEAKIHLDIGQKRQLGDTLELLELVEDAGRERVAVARQIYWLEHNQPPTPTESYDIAIQYSADHSAARKSTLGKQNHVKGRWSAVQLTPFVWAWDIAPERMADLVQRLTSTVGLTEHEARLLTHLTTPIPNRGGGAERLEHALRTLRSIEHIFGLDGKKAPLTRLVLQDRTTILARFNSYRRANRRKSA